MKALILKYYFLEDSDHYVYLLLTPDIGSLESLQHSALLQDSMLFSNYILRFRLVQVETFTAIVSILREIKL